MDTQGDTMTNLINTIYERLEDIHGPLAAANLANPSRWGHIKVAAVAGLADWIEKVEMSLGS